MDLVSDVGRFVYKYDLRCARTQNGCRAASHHMVQKALSVKDFIAP